MIRREGLLEMTFSKITAARRITNISETCLMLIPWALFKEMPGIIKPLISPSPDKQASTGSRYPLVLNYLQSYKITARWQHCYVNIIVVSRTMFSACSFILPVLISASSLQHFVVQKSFLNSYSFPQLEWGLMAGTQGMPGMGSVFGLGTGSAQWGPHTSQAQIFHLE